MGNWTQFLHNLCWVMNLQSSLIWPEGGHWDSFKGPSSLVFLSHTVSSSSIANHKLRKKWNISALPQMIYHMHDVWNEVFSFWLGVAQLKECVRMWTHVQCTQILPLLAPPALLPSLLPTLDLDSPSFPHTTNLNSDTLTTRGKISQNEGSPRILM